MLNLKTIKHIDYSLADPDWANNCPMAGSLLKAGKSEITLSPLRDSR